MIGTGSICAAWGARAFGSASGPHRLAERPSGNRLQTGRAAGALWAASSDTLSTLLTSPKAVSSQKKPKHRTCAAVSLTGLLSAHLTRLLQLLAMPARPGEGHTDPDEAWQRWPATQPVVRLVRGVAYQHKERVGAPAP